MKMNSWRVIKEIIVSETNAPTSYKQCPTVWLEDKPRDWSK